MPNSRCPKLLQHWNTLVRTRSERVVLHDCTLDQSYTFAQIETLIQVTIEQLQSQFSVPNTPLSGRKISFCLPNGAAWLATFLAILRLDAIAIPFDPGLTSAQQAEKAEELQCSLHLSRHGLVVKPYATDSLPDLILGKLTSGSTGKAKVLLFNEAQMIADCEQVCRTMSIMAGDSHHALIPFGHSYGLGNLVFPAILFGTRIVCGSSAFPHILAGEIARHRPTVFPGIPTLIRALAHSTIAKEQLSSLKTVISAGSLLNREIAIRFTERFDLPVHAFYGSSETGGICFDRSGTGAAKVQGFVGPPLEGVHIEIDETQQIVVSSAAVYTHYNPTVVKGQGKHRLADCGHWQPEGLVLTGRVKGFAKIGAKRIDLNALEKTLLSIEEINAVQLTVAEDRKRGEDHITAYLASTTSLEMLKSLISAKIPKWQIPKTLKRVAAFTYDQRGKINLSQQRVEERN